MPAYYTLATIAGAAVLGVDVQPRALEEAMRAVSASSLAGVRRAGPEAGAAHVGFRLGSTVGAVLLAAIAYRVSLVMILAHRKLTAQRPDKTG